MKVITSVKGILFIRDNKSVCVFYMLDKFKYRDSYVDVSFL